MHNLKSLFFSLITFCYKIRYRRLSVEKNVRIYPGTSIAFLYCNRSGSIIIGENANIGSFNSRYRVGWYYPVRLSIMAPNAHIKIKEGTFVNGVNICAKKSIIIGKLCHIASGVQIIDYNGHMIYKLDRKESDQPQPVFIGNNVWIGLNSIILKGTEIGDNSIVAAGSVVKGCFPPFSLIAGNPAKLVRILDENRFS